MFRYSTDSNIRKAVKLWLLAGLVMIFFQIVIGGITRLTGSGLSITRWEIVTGSIPPLNESDWKSEFDLYKATPQYQKINQGMELSAFKFIYFWEYFHRLWARLMFFVFMIPFIWFLFNGMLSKRIVPRLVVMVGLAGLEGFFGWIMVASGLNHRPWVNAYNLTLHLTMALIIFTHLLWTFFIAWHPNRKLAFAGSMPWLLLVFCFIQIAFGALMSGTKAGLLYPSWPDMQGFLIPAVLFDGAQWQTESFTHYDSNPFFPSLVQFLHRNMAYILSGLLVYFSWRHWSNAQIRPMLYLLLGVLSVQVFLGIITLLNCIGQIPVLLGVLHQAGAVVLLAVLTYVTYISAGNKDYSI